MPHKGFYTQGEVILLRSTATLDAVEKALVGLPVLKRIQGVTSWAFGGPSLILAYRREVNGLVSVDIVDRPWPDHMGSPNEQPEIFGAWAMGHFGPFAYPGGLERAIQQSWSWPEAKAAVGQHRAFIRVRSSYVFGSEADTRVMPDDYSAAPELLFVTKVASKLLAMPEALCYFNPNGERLFPLALVTGLLQRTESEAVLPLELWSNIRLFNLGGQWSLMDTVGMSQLDVPDHEACFQTDAYSLQEVDNFLYNAASYVLQNGPVIGDGDTMDGPGHLRWQGATFENGISDPPREVIRWFPMDRRTRPAGLQGEDT